jgi:hypothetical protein
LMRYPHVRWSAGCLRWIGVLGLAHATSMGFALRIRGGSSVGLM